MFRSLLIATAFAVAIPSHAASLQLEKNVTRASVVGVPAVVTYKIFAVPAGGAAMATQAFAAGAWEADLDFSHFKAALNDIVRFRALFTNTAGLNPDLNYFYEIELDGVLKGPREALNNEAWLLFKDVSPFGSH